MRMSIVSPVYGAEKILPDLVRRIQESMAEIESVGEEYEIILVEDGSPDNSWDVMEHISAVNEKVVSIKLSRNFGQHYAITAGLDHAKGDWVVVMDCDLQDQPEEIGKMLEKAKKGYDIVLASRTVRKDSFFKKAFSKLFYSVLGFLVGVRFDPAVANFGIYSSKVISSVNEMRESIRFFPTMIKWVGFRSTKLEVAHDQRAEGDSSYNFRKLLNLALDIILAYSDKPLRITVKVGMYISMLSLIFAMYTVYRWITKDIEVLGYTSLIISIWLLSGLIIATLGVVGLYIGKIFEGVKGRPIYIVAKKLN